MKELNVHPTQFKNLSDLSKLPWFEAYEERVVLSAKNLGPIVDVHTHVALAYLRPIQIDLYKEYEHTEYYLPACCPLDLEPYGNANFTKEAWSEMEKDLLLKTATKHGMRKTHTVPNLLREMDELGIKRSCLLPIDFPILSENASYAIHAGKKSSEIISFGSVHPYAPQAKIKLEEQLHQGIHGIKVHPNVQCIRPDNDHAMALYKLCGERNIPVLWHCGPINKEPLLGRYLTQVKWYEKPIAQNPKTTFILGHSGAMQFEEAIRLARTYPNVYLETASIGLDALYTILDRVDENRVMFGSDWPFYPQAIPLAKVLIATDNNPALREKVLFRNAQTLFGVDS